MSEMQFLTLIVMVVIIGFVMSFIRSKPMRFFVALILFAAAGYGLLALNDYVDRQDAIARDESERIYQENRRKIASGEVPLSAPDPRMFAEGVPQTAPRSNSRITPQPTPDPTREILRKYGTASSR